MSSEPGPTAAGKSSFDLVDAERLFENLSLGPETNLLDVGSGVGNYTLAAAERMGTEGNGRIYAVDLWKEGIAALEAEATRRGVTRIVPMVADVGSTIPVDDESIDVCLIATVLHDLVMDGTHEGALREMRRVLRGDGILAVVEFEKVEGPPGPPVDIKLNPAELEQIVKKFGFDFTKLIDVGPHHYLSLFAK